MPDDREDQDGQEQPVREPMRPLGRGPWHRRPSPDDIKARRRQRRATAAQEESAVTTPNRGDILRAIAAAATLAEQARLVAQLDEFDLRTRTREALEKEADWAAMTVQDKLQPVAVFSRTTSASDWLEDLVEPEVDHARIVAQAARWFTQLSPQVREDAQECWEQARGHARRLASSYGAQAPEVEETFTTYTAFLQRQSASGLDQIQQAVSPDGSTPKATELPQDVFDNFAPAVDPVNSGVVGTETSERNPLLQEISGGGSGGGSPEVPGGHSTGDDVSQPTPGGGSGPSPTPQDAGDGSGPEQAGGHSEGEEEPRRAQAASSLPQIQQTVDVHDQAATTPLPTTVAFPWELGHDQEGMTGEAHYDQGESTPAQHTTAVQRVTADQWTQPHQMVEPNVANTPASTPQAAPGTAAQGRADAVNPEAAPTFADGHLTGGYDAAYSAAAPGPAARDVPVSIGGDNGQARHRAFASRHVASRQDMEAPDFQRGYRYALRWKPGTPLVSRGSAELEAGIYAGITDRSEHRGAWLDAHRRLAARDSHLGARIALHRQLTEQVADERGLSTDGTYLSVEAATSTDLETMSPDASPSPTGQTPFNGPGQPGPLAGGSDPAAAGGASPYNGAQPMGSSVVPSSSAPGGVAQTIPDEGMAPPQRAMPDVSAAFRRTVQAGLLAERKRG